MPYVHPDDRNLTNLHKAMDYNTSGQPIVRTRVDNTWDNPVPVTLGSNTITITGDVVIPATVNVASSPDNPVHVHTTEIGTSGILDVPWMPIAGNVTIDSGNVWINGGEITASQGGTWTVRLGNAVTQGTTPWIITGNANVMITGMPSIEGNVTISNVGNSTVRTTLADGAQLGAFSRLRTSIATNINEYKNVYGSEDAWNFQTVVGGSGSTTFNVNAATTGMTVSTGSSDYVIRQTRMYHTYTPGCGQLVMVTGTLAETKPNLTQRVGYFDDRNGIFFERATNAGNVTVNTWNIRNFNGGSATLAESAAQGSWNIDNFDGSGPSGVSIQWDKVQIWFVDFQWLGVGRVRCGFDINGILYYAHEFNHANNITSTYMGNPSLPVRYEIRNTGTTSGSSTMTAVCAAVQTEGGTQQNIWRYSVTTGPTGITCGTAEKGVIAIRLKNMIGPNNNVPNHTLAQLADFTLFGSQQSSWRLLLAANSTVISGSPVWTSVDQTSYVEYATDITLQNLSGNTLPLTSGFISTAQGSASGSAAVAAGGSKSSINQNYDSSDSQIIILAAQRIGNQDTIINAAMNWLELS